MFTTSSGLTGTTDENGAFEYREGDSVTFMVGDALDLNFIKSNRQQKLPVVLTQTEVSLLFRNINKRHYQIASLLYGSGLRLIEAVKIRVQDIDFDYKKIRIWNGKGNKNRIVTLVEELIPMLRNQIIQVDEYLQLDLKNDAYAGVWCLIELVKNTQVLISHYNGSFCSYHIN